MKHSLLLHLKRHLQKPLTIYMKQLLAIFTLISFFNLNFLQAQCISGNCSNGTGTYLYPSGAKYIGQFKDGEIQGIGVCYYTDGSKYQGQWVHRYPEGRGTKILADGKEWTGAWVKGQPVDEEGNIIEDLFAEEELDDGTDIQSGCITGNCDDGEGIFAYADGSRYEGQFLSSKPDGWGTFFYLNGEKFIGTFLGGYKNGKGTYYHVDESQTIGEWKDGEYIGNPQIEYGRVGCVSGDCDNGRGIYIYKDGAAKYSGTFKNSLPDGDGVVYYANGERYSGLWAAGSFDGEGTLFMKDGTEVTGIWEQGTYMGDGKPTELVEEAVAEIIEDDESINLEEIAAIQAASNMKVWAVIIGIASYNHMPTLRYTDDDAYRMYAFLKSPEGGAIPDDQIRILIDEDATKAKIENTMQSVFNQAEENDLVLLYFSGHGLKGSFLPIDFDGFNNKLDHEEINKILDSSPAKYKLCIADACHSGSLLAMKSGSVKNVLAEYYKNLALAEPGTALIMSSKSDETSLESSGLRQGVFSHFLIRGLKGEADEDENDLVSIQELFNFIDKNVRNYTGNRQSPVIQGDYDETMPVSVVR